MIRKVIPLGLIILTFAFAVTLFAADAPKPDLSTPKATVRSLYDAMLAGDFNHLSQFFVTPTTDAEKQLLAEGFSDDMYAPALSAAIRAKFPDAKIPSADKMIAYLKDSLDKMDEKIDGDTATLTRPAAATQMGSGPASEPVTLNKISGEWKIALTRGRFLRLPPEQFRAMAQARKTMMAQLITDVNADKFATYPEVETAMRSRMQEVQQKYATTSSRPASAPASHPNH